MREQWRPGVASSDTEDASTPACLHLELPWLLTERDVL